MLTSKNDCWGSRRAVNIVENKDHRNQQVYDDYEQHVCL